MSKYVYVVTNPELGWDCVCAVYDNKEAAEQHVASSSGACVMHDVVLEQEFAE